MIRITPPPQLGTPPDQYDKNYMLTLIRQLTQFIDQVITPGQGVEGTLQLLGPTGRGLPQGGYGLKIGEVWEENGFLKIVRSTDVFAPSLSAKFKIGKAVAA